MDFQIADHILIPLLDGTHALAQVVQTQGDRALLYLSDRIFRPDTPVTPLTRFDVLAILFAELSTLPDGHWSVAGYDAVPPLRRVPDDLSWDLLDKDTTFHDPAIIEAFANAIHGLYPWDGFPDPDFFTNLLRDPDTLPKQHRLSADMPDIGNTSD